MARGAQRARAAGDRGRARRGQPCGGYAQGEAEHRQPAAARQPRLPHAADGLDAGGSPAPARPRMAARRRRSRCAATARAAGWTAETATSARTGRARRLGRPLGGQHGRARRRRAGAAPPLRARRRGRQRLDAGAAARRVRRADAEQLRPSPTLRHPKVSFARGSPTSRSSARRSAASGRRALR